MTLASALAAAVLLGVAWPAGAVSDGEPAPSVSLASLDGRPIDLTSLRGRVVVLDFWASWCAPCVEQLRALDAFARESSPEEVTVVAVSIDDEAEDARRFIAAKLPGTRLRIAHDPGGSALSAFGADGIPALYVLDAEGVVRDRHSGPGGTVGLAGQVAAARKGS